MEDEDAAERTVLLQKESRLSRSWETRNGATANLSSDAQHSCVEGLQFRVRPRSTTSC